MEQISQEKKLIYIDLLSARNLNIQEIKKNN